MVSKRQIMLGLKMLFFIATLGIIVWSCTAMPESYPVAKAQYYIPHTGWNQVIDGEEIPLVTIEEFIETDEAELVFTRKVEEVDEGDVFLFYSWNQEVHTYIDETCIHDFSIQDGFEFLKTPGCAWNQIDLTEEMNGSAFTLVLGNVGRGNLQVVPNFYLVEDEDVGVVRMREIGFRIFVAILMLVMAISSFINIKMWKKDTRRMYYMSLAHLYLSIFFWLLAELNGFDIFFHRPVTSYLLSMMFIRMIPLSLFYVMLPKKAIAEKWRYVIHGVILGNFCFAFAAQFFFGISLLKTMWINTLLIVFIMGMCGWIILRKIFYWKNIDHNDYYYLLAGIFIIGGVLDLVVMLVEPGPSMWSGLYTVIASVIYFMITYTLLGFRNSRIVVEKAEMDEHYKKLQSASLMEQMKSHFIFNTLNAISELCKRDDAKEADHAVKLFAKYLRSYMYLINQQENIPFEKEMDLVRAYLVIEHMRFEEMLEFEIDLEYQEFDVPPLSLQPIVENAVLHGVRQRSGIGSIFVTSRRYHNCVEVTVRDNGVGFDIVNLEKETSVGIRNMKKRMEMQVGGSVEIESVIGKGTQVTITIPVSEEK